MADNTAPAPKTVRFISVFVPGMPGSDTLIDPATDKPWTLQAAKDQVAHSRLHGVDAEWYIDEAVVAEKPAQ